MDASVGRDRHRDRPDRRAFQPRGGRGRGTREGHGLTRSGGPEAARASSPDGRSRSRTSEIYARLRDDVIQGNFPPGTKLKIEGLREHYGLGATPIREALSMLAADGLVERVEQRGFRVAEMRSGEFEELLAVRCTTEERALRLSIERGGKDWEEAIVLARYRLSAKPRLDSHGNVDLEWEAFHKAFHMSLVSGCGSPLLLRLANQFYDENNRYRFVARLNPSQRRDVDVEHGRIADAVLARDADAAVSVLVDHYRTTGEILHTALRQREETALTAATSATSEPAKSAASASPSSHGRS